MAWFLFKQAKQTHNVDALDARFIWRLQFAIFKNNNSYVAHKNRFFLSNFKVKKLKFKNWDILDFDFHFEYRFDTKILKW